MASQSRHTPAPREALARATLAVIGRVRARHCAFFAINVAEVMRPLPIAGLANMPSFVLGVSVIRGTPTPVVDAGALLGDDRATAQTTRFVVMRVGERRVALAVEAVLGVRALVAETLMTLPPLVRNAAEEVVTALGTLDAELLAVLGSSYLVPAALWEELDARSDSMKAPA